MSDLVGACKAGDASALERLFQQHASRVYRWSVMLGLSAVDAEDAAQEVLATAARRIEQCASDEMLPSWLFQITRRIVANTRRSAWLRRIWKKDDGTEAKPAFEDSGADSERELAVRRCFAKLSHMHAEVLLLAGVEGYTVPEVAKMLGVPEGTVSSRLRLARAAFTREWEA